MPKADKKTKLCWNCEGSVAREAINCKFCGVYLQQNEDQESDLEDSEEGVDLLKESSSYQMTEFKEEKIEIPRSPFTKEEPTLVSTHKNISVPQEVLTHSQSWQALLFPLLFLSSASFLLLFAFLLYFFSEAGVLILKWKAEHWFLYLTAALPLLVLGWRSLLKVRD